jgi:hypothetical protein
MPLAWGLVERFTAKNLRLIIDPLPKASCFGYFMLVCGCKPETVNFYLPVPYTILGNFYQKNIHKGLQELN